MAQGSLCQAKLTQAYFVSGALPSPDTICDVDFPYFTDDDGLTYVIEKLGFLNTTSATTTTKRRFLMPKL